jgi:LPXTG-motif cell wall-anchored protein
LLGKSLVCYERLYLVVDDKEYLVAVHEDIEDKDQTVTYDNFVGYIDMHIDLHTGGQGHKVSKRPGTGDPVKLFLLLGAALVSGSVVGVMIYKKKKGDKRHED